MSNKGVYIENGNAVYGDVDLVQPQLGERAIDTFAVGYHHLVRARALGQHYSVVDKQSVHRTPIGVDGVGKTSEDFVYFVNLKSGTYAKKAVAPEKYIIPIPKGTDEAGLGRVAALTNGVMSSMFAFARLANVPKNPVVAILGVSGAAGKTAISVSKKVYGASKVIGFGRNIEKLKALKEAQPLLDEFYTFEDRETSIGEADIVLDYLWGEPTLKLIGQLHATKKELYKPVYWIEIGQISGSKSIELPAGLFRSINFNLLGSGLGPLTPAEEQKALKKSVELLASGEINDSVSPVKIENVEEIWNGPFGTDSRVYFKF